MCGGNGQDCGGLELHHIFGRVSSSPLNASVVCGKCHRQMGHSFEEQHHLLWRNLHHLARIYYKSDEDDQKFWESIKQYHDPNTN